VGYKANISGVESRGVACDHAELAVKFALRYGRIAAMTGAVDIVTDGARIVRVANGHPMMTLVTGTGCMATSVVAAYAAVETDFVAASAIALAAYGLAGEVAARKATGPGSMHVGLYDALAGLNEQSLRAGLRIEVAQQ
jgi:hydroxyethylthiazole kinase